MSLSLSRALCSCHFSASRIANGSNAAPSTSEHGWRGGSRLGAWRLWKRRLLAPHARLHTAPHGRWRPLFVGVKAADTAPARAVEL